MYISRLNVPKTGEQIKGEREETIIIKIYYTYCKRIISSIFALFTVTFLIEADTLSQLSWNNIIMHQY